MAKHATPLLDQLETGPWPSFVSDIKQLAESRAKNAQGLDYQIPSDAPEDLLGIMELSYEDKETHWKHGGIVGVFGYGGGVIGRYCDQPEKFPGIAHFHTMRVAQPAAKFYNTKFLRDLCDIWDLRGSGITNIVAGKGIAYMNGNLMFNGINASQVAVYNLTGSTLANRSLANGTSSINMPLAPGVYVVKVVDNNGKTFTKKIQILK